ncbi:MAG: heteromeric transposase endonuclease subunit TnsA [Deltaproteobacteria bacterium HGW-Deltaproteobacteria-3]|nr:MAG: heteromeric transposase endonuclease subunit TnsA [Deltaproteobacteria bacterium HGW-Deltaproteobacteria-3]
MTAIKATKITKITATDFGNNKNSCDEVKEPHQVRRIRPTRRSVSGAYPFRGEESIPFESTLERDFLIRKEFSRFVMKIVPQPARIPFRASNEQEYHYTPDFLVYYRAEDYPGGLIPLLVEVKPRSELREHWHEMKPKFKAALRYAREQGWNFRIHDETRIRDQVFQNIYFLKRYKRMEFPAEEAALILDYLDRVGQAPFRHLIDIHFIGRTDTIVGISHVWHLLATGRLECDMTTPLGNDTVLWRPYD